MWEIVIFENYAICKANKLKLVLKLVLIYFGRPSPGHAIKINFITFQNVDPEICSNWFLIKGSGTSFTATFCVCFVKKNISHVIFY